MVAKASSHILIMAGGTGGHVFPALAVAECLRDQGAEVSWMGTRRGLEARVVPGAGFNLEYISVSGLRGKGALSWGLAPFKLSLALYQALWVCLRKRPHAVLGMGGFVTGPGGVAAYVLGRPLLIHEQNAIAGMTNRLLSRLAYKVMAAFPDAFPKRRFVEITGNPVRKAICELPEPAQRFAKREGAIRLLIIGGSLGAQALNEGVPQALAMLAAAQRPEIRHQTGKGKLSATRASYQRAGIEARVDEFIEDMAEAYAWADLVICRAGALTVSELAAAGVGAIFVPYPHAVDDHQTANAGYLVNVDAARLLPQAEFTPARMHALLDELLSAGRAQLLSMAQAARAAAMPDATSMVAQCCLEAAHG